MIPIIATSFALVTGGLIKNRGELILLGLAIIIVTFVLAKRLRTR
jgi:hypothetical protein